MKKLSAAVLSLCALSFPDVVVAEVHNVAVLDSFFSPNDLVIRPGDTVVWTDRENRGECDYEPCPAIPLHNVKADDGSFTSGPPADAWTYERVFGEPGDILYHCEVHGAPGMDINTFMNGRITVQAEPETEFDINAGLNDAWYNSATDGQGFLVSVFPDISQMFVAWFTFDVERPPENIGAFLGEPGHRWLTAQGPYEGDKANLTIYLTEGGTFDSAEPAAEVDTGGIGTMMIEFADCGDGLLTYEITTIERSGEIPIQRIVSDNVSLCESLAAP